MIIRGGRGPFHANRSPPLRGGTVITGPKQFTFTDVANVPLNATETSNTITLTGSGGPYTASVTGGTMSINGGAFGSTSTSVSIGNTIAVRHTSSATDSTSVNTTLTVGTTSDTFTSTTVASLSTLADNFNDNSIDASKWDTGNFFTGSATAAGTVAETASTAQITPPASTAGSNYTGYISHLLYDFTGSSAFAKVTNVGSLPTTQEVYFAVGPDVNNHYLILLSGGSLYLQKVKAGTKTSIVQATTYSSTTNAWWRLRESGGTIFLDTAPSSAANPPASGDWVNNASAAIDATIIPDKTQIHVAFGSGTNASATTPKAATFDGFNGAT